MIEGEIRVGDRFVEAREATVIFLGRDEIFYHANGFGSTSRTEAEFRSMFSRPSGWTRITDRLPGDDVEEVIMWSSVLGYVHVGRDAHVCRWGVDRFRDGILTHWRPVPPEFFPLPKESD